jgi:hypothetical protein
MDLWEKMPNGLKKRKSASEIKKLAPYGLWGGLKNIKKIAQVTLSG